MESRTLAVKPSILSFITTNKCTAACKNCCFSCNPKNKERLELSEMMDYIEQATTAYPTIKILVLSGGECFTLGKDLLSIIEFGNKKGLITRVVTNAYWAVSFKAAYKKLHALQEAGLKELNISTGDEHQHFVPYDSIVNAIIAGMKLSLEIVVNVECSEISTFTSVCFFNDSRLKKYQGCPNLRILSGVWIAFKKSTAVENKKSDKHGFCIPKMFRQRRCDSLFNTISIDCYHQMNACCGLTLDYIPYLHLGDLKKYSLSFLYERQFNDFLKLWLYIDGPAKILSYCAKMRNKQIDNIDDMHLCQICAEIFKERENIEIVKNNIKDLQTDVFLKYKLLLKN